MSLINRVPKILEKNTPERWITVLDADEVTEEPKLEFKIQAVSDGKLSILMSPFDRKGKKTNLSQSENAEFRAAYLLECVKGWRGMTTGNARRMCLILLEHPELIAAETPSEWVWDLDDLKFLAENMSGVIFSDIMTATLELEAFAREVLKRTKN